MSEPQDDSAEVFGRSPNIPPPRPLGRFRLDYGPLDPFTGLWQSYAPIFIGLVPMKIEVLPVENAIEYTCLGECFDPIEHGELIPIYRITPIAADFGDPQYQFTRVIPTSDSVSQS